MHQDTDTREQAQPEPPDPEKGWATPKGAVRWEDMANQIAWLESKATASTIDEEREDCKRKADTLRGWCKLFEHELPRALR